MCSGCIVGIQEKPCSFLSHTAKKAVSHSNRKPISATSCFLWGSDRSDGEWVSQSHSWLKSGVKCKKENEIPFKLVRQYLDKHQIICGVLTLLCCLYTRSASIKTTCSCHDSDYTNARGRVWRLHAGDFVHGFEMLLLTAANISILPVCLYPCVLLQTVTCWYRMNNLLHFLKILKELFW